MSSKAANPPRLDPARLYLLPLGIGNAFTARHYNSSFMLFFDGQTTLVDAPAPLSRVVAEASRQAGLSITLADIDNLVLTHLHGDHCNGVEELGFWRKYQATGKKPRLFVLEDLREALWKHRLYAAMGPEYHRDKDPGTGLDSYFQVVPMTFGKKVPLGRDGSFLEAHPTQHMVPCAAFRLQCNGISFGYSADTAYDPGLIEFLSDCDFIVHETGEGKGHTPLARLEALPPDLKARIHLTHVADDFDREATTLPVLEEGRLYKIGGQNA